MEGGPGLPLGVAGHAHGHRAFSAGWRETEAKQPKFKARPWAADQAPESHHAPGELRPLTIITRLTHMGRCPRLVWVAPLAQGGKPELEIGGVG